MIIGFHGSLKSGKTSSANYLVDRGFRRLSFAKPLKDIVAEGLREPRELFDDQTKKDVRLWTGRTVTTDEAERIVSAGRRLLQFSDEAARKSVLKLAGYIFDRPREILQFVGSDIFRDCVDSDFWVIVAERQMSVGDNYVVEDVRYDNEATMIHRNHGPVIKIIRPGLTVDTSSSHKSENGISPHLVTLTIVNEGSLEQLQDKINEVTRGIGNTATQNSR